MAHPQAFLKTIIISAIFLLLIALSAHADGIWKTFTATNEMRRMRIIDDTLFIASSGGLVVVPSIADEPLVLTNIDGLGSTDLTDVVQDADGQKWVTGSGGLTRFALDGSTFFPSNNQDGSDRLLCVDFDADKLWIGCENGLLLFSKSTNGGQFMDRYSISLANPFPIVNDVEIVGDTIWLATSIGIACGITTIPSQLKSPANWKIYDLFSNPELTVTSQSRVVAFHNLMYVGNPYGVFRYTIDTLLSDTSFALMPVAVNRVVQELKVENDTLFAYSAGNFRYITSGGAIGAPSLSGLTVAPRNGATNGQLRWLGVLDSGYYHNASGSFEPFMVEGLPDNSVSDVAVNRTGKMTALFDADKSVGQRVSGEWSVAPLLPKNIYQATTLASIDSAGNYWLGTFGNGLFRLSGDSLTNFDEQNSTLIGNSDGVQYVVMKGLAVTSQYLFAACYRAVNGNPICIVPVSGADYESAWTSLGISDGITNSFASALDVHGPLIAYGTEGNGVYLYYYGDNPFDKSDDHVRHFTETDASLLVSNSITAVRFSPTGELWGGTSFGLTRYDDGTERWIDTDLPSGIGPEVIDIDFDFRGTMWVAARGGLVRFDATSGDVEAFTPQNSGLVSDAFHALTVDRFRGDLYISTLHGISLLTSGFAEPSTEVTGILAFPNPFVIDNGSVGLRFNFAGGGTARIFTVAGEHVIDMPVNGVWDGRNGAGKEVASGVYLFTVTDTQGNIGHGKFLLVRQ